MKTLIPNRFGKLMGILSLLALASCATTRDSHTQYIDISSPGYEEAVRSLRIDQNFQFVNEQPYGVPSQSQYVDIWRNGRLETIYTPGVDQVISLGNKQMIVTQDGRQILTQTNSW